MKQLTTSHSMMRFLHLCKQTAHLMVGQGDYQYYLQHMQNCHPDLVPMTEVDFFRRNQDARYPQAKGKATINRCPC